MIWTKVKDRLPEPSKVVECHGKNIRGDYRINLKWELYEKPIRKKLGCWMHECWSGSPITYWTRYPQWREIIEWREIEGGDRNA